MKRLADNRDQEQCRYLMKLFRQLNTTYQEVTEDQLRTHICADKVEAVEGRSARSQGQHWVHGSAAFRALPVLVVPAFSVLIAVLAWFIELVPLRTTDQAHLSEPEWRQVGGSMSFGREHGLTLDKTGREKT